MSKLQKINCLTCKHCGSALELFGQIEKSGIQDFYMCKKEVNTIMDKKEGIVSVPLKEGKPFIDKDIIAINLVQPYYGCKHYEPKNFTKC